MPASTYKLNLLPLIVCYLLVILCATTGTLMGGCDCRYRDPFLTWHSRRCSSGPIFHRGLGPYDYDGRLCRTNHRLEDCLLAQFQCVGNFRCIPRRYVCNGIPDCGDGSDEWGCFSDTTTTTTVSTTTRRMYSESTEHTSSYSITTSTIVQANEEETSRDAFPESRANTYSTPTTESMIRPYSEQNNVLSSTTTPKITMLPHSESNTFISLTTSTIIPNFESITTTSSSTTTQTMIPDTELKTAPTPSPYTMKIESESNTTASSFTTTSTMIPDSESKTAPSSSKTSTMIPDNESNTDTSNPTTTKTINSVSEENSSTFAAHNTMVPESVEKTLPSTTNNIFPESSEMLSCPANYCMQNAECIVVKGQYRCKCPSSSDGELCELKLGTEQSSIQYTVAIALSMAFVVLCLVVITVCIYRYKRLTSWKFRDMTSRTLSQMTLASNAME